MTTFPPIEELLSHRDNMLLLKEVVAFSTSAVTCRLEPDCNVWYALGETGDMPAWIGIELMAQAIASHVALRSIREGKKPRPGALLGTRAYQTSQPFFAAGEALTVRAHESCRTADGLASYDCAVLSPAGEQLATAALTVYEPADFEQFILGRQE
jgi:predicted hotdog family 3-hydroxylacyl-ACP dehydratase